MATVNVSGLPINSKLPKLVIIFKSLFKREGIMKFWIKEMSETRGTDMKSAKIEFNSVDEAYIASKLLNGFEYNDGQYVHRLSSRVDNEERGRPRWRSPSPYDHRPRYREYQDTYEPHHSRYDGYSRDRSRSPTGHESTKLDLEIELLRKQRMIIEEERRILLERKKLELVKEFGPSALKEFKSLEDDRDRDRDRRYRPERAAPYRPRRRSPPPPPRAFPTRQRPPKQETGTKQNRMHLPQFILPCKLLLGELKETMEKLGTRKESFLLTKLIRATIRKRLAVALEGKPIMSGVKIVNLYREKYPQHQDEDFVKKHLNDVRACHMLSKGDDAAAEKPEKSSDEEAKEETENNENGEKVDAGAAKTDARIIKTEPEKEANEITGVTVKEEPNTSADTLVNENIEPEEQNENKVHLEQSECGRSVGSSEALTLHDKNEEDWAEGESDWDDSNVQEEAPQQ